MLLGQALVLPTHVCVKTLSCDSLLIVTGIVLWRHAVVVAVGGGEDDFKVVVCVVGSVFGSSDSYCVCVKTSSCDSLLIVTGAAYAMVSCYGGCSCWG